MTLGRADDNSEANGLTVLTFDQADAAARAAVGSPAAKVHRLTVRRAWANYIDYKRALGQQVDRRGAVHILPSLGDLVVEELTAEQLRRWLATMAATPAQTRPRAGQPQYREEALADESTVVATRRHNAE
jgi:hypothetical protein